MQHGNCRPAPEDNGLREVSPPGGPSFITVVANRACGQNLAWNWMRDLLRRDRTVSILFLASNTTSLVCGCKCTYSSRRQKHIHGCFAEESCKLSNSQDTFAILILLRGMAHPDQPQRVSVPTSQFQWAHISQHLSQNLREKEQEAQVVPMEPQEVGPLTVF